MDVVMLLVAVGVAGGLGYLVARRGGRGGGSMAALRRRMRIIVRDPAVVDRLIEAERKRKPELGEKAATRRALRKLEYQARR